MQTPPELRLLRLAVAHGLVTWDDLESVARRLSGGESDDGAIDPAAWLEALVAEGLLERAALDRLAATETGTAAVRGDGGRAPASPDVERADREVEVLERWGRYELVGRLGAGGMGTVYKVFDPSLMRFAAVKILQKHEPGLGRRLLREARAQARVDHPHVCQVYEAGEVAGRAYIAMQYVDGSRFDDAVAGLPHDEIVRLLIAVARAVDAAHETGLVHRDLKPGNILIRVRGSGGLHPYVLDFGLAKDLGDPSFSRTDVITGTPAYLSPEQVRGHAVDRRTDIFGLGVVLYEALTGRTPFAASSIPETLIRITSDDPVRPRKIDPTVPVDLETVVLRCLEKDPARRYASAREVADDLERYLAGEPILAHPPSLGYRLSKRLRRNRALAAVAALAAAALLGAAALLAYGQWRAHERAVFAQRFGQEVQEVETTLGYALLLPLHDTSGHKRALRRRMASIEREMARLGELAEGPGRYALGLGHLSLHRYEEAREHLQAAWTAGYREPEVAIALGRALGQLYAHSLAEAGAPPGSADRQGFLREVRRAYREPAASYLRAAREDRSATGAAADDPAAGGAALYLEGLQALFEGRHARALEAARKAAEVGSPEARRLEATIHGVRADEALAAGSYEEARNLYERAGAVYAELMETYRSDASLYAEDCGRRSRLLELHARTGRLPDAELGAALEACELALAADPDLAEAHAHRARIFWQAATDRSLRGLEPSAELFRAVAAARRAIELDPRHIAAHKHLAVAFRQLAEWRMRAPGTPEPSAAEPLRAAATAPGGPGPRPVPALADLDAAELLERAIAAARAAVELAPERSSAHNSLGNVHVQRAALLSRRGADPLPDLARAIAAYRRAAELNPRAASGPTNLGNAWKLRAEIEIERGADPSASIERSIAALRRALAVNPASAPAHNNLGNAYLTLGVWALERGAGAQAAEPLDRAAASYRRSLEINPQIPYGFYNLAFAERCRAAQRVASGRDPRAALESARTALAEAIRLDPSDPDNRIEAERIETVARLWQQRQGV